MSQSRHDFLAESLQALLDRRSMPKRLEGKGEKAEADEVRALLRVLLRAAPTQGYAEWWEGMEVEIGRSCRTQGWPGEGQFWDAADAVADERRERKPSRTDGGAAEETALQALESWFQKFKSEMPGIGSSSRTKALIERGTLRSLREARFRGFALDPADLMAALAQPMDPDEWRHHVTVTARFSRFKDMTWSEVEAICKSELTSEADPAALAQAANRIASGVGKSMVVSHNRSPRTPRSHLEGEASEPAIPPKTYTPEELARIRSLHGLADPEAPSAPEQDPDAWRSEAQP